MASCSYCACSANTAQLFLQGLPPPPPRPDAASVAPTPTPAQQTPTAPFLEASDEQEPEQSSTQEEQQQQSPQEKDTSNDQPVPQPAVDQNRPPVKPHRRPSAPAPQVSSCCHCSVATAGCHIVCLCIIGCWLHQSVCICVGYV